MTVTPGLPDPADDGALARQLAGSAGDLLRELRGQLGFGDPAALRQAGDRRSHEFLTMALARWRPDDSVLSEEGADPAGRLAADRVWIVDPLDGTREYAESGRGDWAVHVALWERKHNGLTQGAVALPARGVVLGADAPPRAPEAAAGRLRLAASRTRPPDFLAPLAESLDAELVPMGSAGAKVCAVIEGTVDAYVHTGGQYEWDSAAPVAVALATGLHASRVDGSTLEYNNPSPRLPDLVVCRSNLADRLLTALADLGVRREA